MAETEITVTEKKTSSARTIFWAVVITLVVLTAIYFLTRLGRKMFTVNMSNVNAAITALVNNPPNPFPTTPITVTQQTATAILTDQVNAILKNRAAMKSIKDYASLSGMTAEQVLVNEAYTVAHNYGWL
jgi:hypothetical protein